MGMNVKTDRTADLRESIENIERDEYLIAHTSDIDDDFPRQLMREGSVNLRNHGDSGILRGRSFPSFA